MSITMQELAYMAGVSRSTVDRVLNGRGRVNAETEQRIRHLAESMGYTPNIAAKALASKHKTIKIGCIINAIGNLFFNKVTAGIDAAAEELSGFEVEIVTRNVAKLSVSQQISLLEQMADEGVQAIAITPINDARIAEKLNTLIAKGIPVVALTADIADVDYLSYVGCNHMKSGRITANLAAMISGSSSNIAFVVGSKTLLGHKQRLSGFQEVIKERYPNIHLTGVIENQDDDFISYSKVSQFLAAHPDTDMIIFAAGGSHGGIRAIQDLEYKCKIIAFDLTEQNKQYLEQDIISCILYQEPFTQGFQAIKILGDYLLFGKNPDKNRLYTKTEVVVREAL